MELLKGPYFCSSISWTHGRDRVVETNHMWLIYLPHTHFVKSKSSCANVFRIKACFGLVGAPHVVQKCGISLMRSGSGWRTKWNLVVVAALSNSLAFKWEQTCNFVKLNFFSNLSKQNNTNGRSMSFLIITACQLNTSLLFLWECLLFTNWGGIFVGLVIIYKEAQEKKVFL